MIHSASPQSRPAVNFRSILKFCDIRTYEIVLRENSDHYCGTWIKTSRQMALSCVRMCK